MASLSGSHQDVAEARLTPMVRKAESNNGSPRSGGGR
ncbi:hypothetical protein J2Y48_004563 [Mycoplana sp. BE70]|nr:hypothetical protein [Mycoplana sp. BE70]